MLKKFMNFKLEPLKSRMILCTIFKKENKLTPKVKVYKSLYTI